MLKRKFDPALAYKVVLYLRMSSDKQNPRSPDQQEAEIRQKLKSLGLNWIIIKVYRDDGKSGRYERKRPEYQQMMQDIRSGVITPDLILVDTLERFGRTDNLEQIRKELRDNYGVHILTAESSFSDPTTPQGKIFGAFESMRASEENRIKAHQVLRGKRDVAKRGFWPGGPRPFGFKFVSIMETRNGMEEKIGTKLEPLPEEAAVIAILFQRADETGHGSVRLTKFLNKHPDIPEHLRPFNSSTVGRWLDQPLYKGDLLWNVHSTDILNDARVTEKNPEEELILISEFCEPLVSVELWDIVQAVRNSRRQKSSDSEDQKLIKPLSAGKSLIYPLSGLVRCGLCDASMRPIKSGRQSKTGNTYTYYVCPRSIDGICENESYIPEQWLMETVIDWIKQQLFPGMF